MSDATGHCGGGVRLKLMALDATVGLIVSVIASVIVTVMEALYG